MNCSCPRTRPRAAINLLLFLSMQLTALRAGPCLLLAPTLKPSPRWARGLGSCAQLSHHPRMAVDPLKKRRISSVSNTPDGGVGTKPIWEPVSCPHQSSFPGHCTHVTAILGHQGALRTTWSQASSWRLTVQFYLSWVAV